MVQMEAEEKREIIEGKKKRLAYVRKQLKELEAERKALVAEIEVLNGIRQEHVPFYTAHTRGRYFISKNGRDAFVYWDSSQKIYHTKPVRLMDGTIMGHKCPLSWVLSVQEELKGKGYRLIE